MNSFGWAILAIVVLFVVLLILGLVFASRYKKVGPNQVLVISGRKGTYTDPASGQKSRRSFRIVRGGGAFILPVVERVDILSLELITIEVITQNVYTLQGVPVTVDGVAQVKAVAKGETGVLLNAVLDPEPYSTEAFALIPDIRDAAHEAGGPDTLVGGGTAVEYDIREANNHDVKLIVPLVLLVVFLILMVLLRAVAAPLMLIGTVVISFLAALGVGVLVSEIVFDFPGTDPSLPLFAFVFLVALGIDYNIFLMARVREETETYGTREGLLRGFAVTGGVITSAGVVLAGTFLVLSVLPLVFLTELGFTVAFGVLLDTFLVRSILVPALTLDIGSKVWWPSALAKDKTEE